MRGTWLVAMLVIMSAGLMSVCESARISVDIAKKTVPQKEANWDWKETACSVPCDVFDLKSQNWRECMRSCRARLPGIDLSMKKANDWKDIPCSVCSYSGYPEYCERFCRGTLPVLKEEANNPPMRPEAFFVPPMCSLWCFTNPKGRECRCTCHRQCS